MFAQLLNAAAALAPDHTALQAHCSGSVWQGRGSRGYRGDFHEKLLSDRPNVSWLQDQPSLAKGNLKGKLRDVGALNPLT